MAVLKYNTNAKSAAYKCRLSWELHSSLVYQAEELEEFSKFIELCMKLD
jgi:hypothetical protein